MRWRHAARSFSRCTVSMNSKLIAFIAQLQRFEQANGYGG